MTNDPTDLATGSSYEHWTARHGKPIIFVILTLVAVGVYLAFSIPIAVFPETNFPRIVIGADNGVAPIDQMMVTVTRPIEEAVNGIPGIELVKSVTSRGTAEINLYFSWKVDMFRTLEWVNASLARVRSNLPAGTSLMTERLTFAAFPIMGYSLTSDRVSQTRLWEIATYEMKPRLNRLNGVATVVVQGGEEPEFEIRPNPAKMLEASVTVPSLLEAVGRSNMVDSPGMIEANHQLVLSLVTGQARTPEEIGSIAVKITPAGLPVRIGDVATVQPSVRPVYTVVTANGKPAVLLNVNRQPDGNTVLVAEAVHAEIASIRQSLPPGVELQPFYDQSEIINDSIHSVRDAILIGLILASIIMVVFLRDWGTSLVAGLVIPATVAVTFITLRLFGESFNLMTLGGLAAAVGLVIDDAIVVVENIVMHRDRGQSRSEAIRSAIREISKPLVGSTLTPIVVFLPLISITGVTGVFFRALAITVGMAVLTSLAFALTWTPTLSHYFIRERRGGAAAEAHSERAGFMGWLLGVYEWVLRRALAHPAALTAVLLALVAGSYFCYQSVGTDLLPPMDEGGFILDYLTPPGSSLAETNRVMAEVDRVLHSIPEVQNTSRRTGLELGLAQVTEANNGDFTVRLKRDRSRSSEEVISEVREKITERFPNVEFEFVLLLQDMIGDLTSAPEPVEIKLFSQDPEVLSEWAPKLGEKLDKIPGVVDVLDGIENTISGPAISFQVDPAVAARSGFTPEEVEINTAALIEGEVAPTPLVANDRAYTIRVRYPAHARASLDAIRNTMLVSSSGRTATLGALAPPDRVAGTDRDPPRESAAGRGGHRAVGGIESGGRHRRRTEGSGGPQDAAGDSRRVRRRLSGATAVVQGFGHRSNPGDRAGLHGAPVRVRELRRPGGDSVVGVAVDLGRVPGAAGHGRDLQHRLVHGADHGDRHRGEERHSAPRCQRPLPGGGSARLRGDGPGGRTPAAAHSDDRAGHGGGDGSPGAGPGGRLPNASAPGHRGDRRRAGLHGAVPGGHTGRTLLPDEARTRAGQDLV